MTTAVPMTPAEQNELLGTITTMFVEQLPQGWRRLVMDFVCVGKYVSASTGVKMADGSVQRWNPPGKAANLFAKLRKGMYHPGRGTWYSLELIIDPPATYSIKYNWDERPPFRAAPPSENFSLDLKYFPRNEENIPEWFRDGLNG